MKRSPAPVRRSTIPRRRNKPRRTSSVRDDDYKAFLNAEASCTVCGRPGPDAAHTENGGMSMKGDDSSCAPLCRIHHREFDSGRAAFEERHGIDMKACAAGWWRIYQGRIAAVSLAG